MNLGTDDRLLTQADSFYGLPAAASGLIRFIHSKTGMRMMKQFSDGGK